MVSFTSRKWSSTAWIVVYGYVVEAFVAWYSGSLYERQAFADRVAGPYGPAYWALIACNGLGLTYITDLLGQVVLFVPKVIVALVILAFGAYFAAFVGSTVITYCRNVGLKDGELLGRIAQYAIIAFVVLIALDQMSVGGDIVRHSFLILLGGVVLGLALAFGIGGQKAAAELLQRWWPRGRDG